MGKRVEEPAPTAPAWLVSFSDMTTLLLTFFVLLQSFAVSQSPELFFQGQGAFKAAIAGWGVPDWFFGKEQKLEAEQKQQRYPTEESDDDELARTRVLDAEDERIREMFKSIQQQVETKTSQKPPAPGKLIVTPVRFADGKAELDDPAREYLTNLAQELRQNVHQAEIEIYVLAAASDVPAGRSQWRVSTRRATVVADVLRQNLDASWKLIPWGAGAGRPAAPSADGNGRVEDTVRIVIVGAK